MNVQKAGVEICARLFAVHADRRSKTPMERNAQECSLQDVVRRDALTPRIRGNRMEHVNTVLGHAWFMAGRCARHAKHVKRCTINGTRLHIMATSTCQDQA